MKNEDEIRAEFNRYIIMIKELQAKFSNDKILSGHIMFEFQVLCWVLNEDLDKYFSI